MQYNKKAEHSVLFFKHCWCEHRRQRTKKKAGIPFCFFNLLRDNIGGTVTKKRLAFRFVV